MSDNQITWGELKKVVDEYIQKNGLPGDDTPVWFLDIGITYHDGFETGDAVIKHSKDYGIAIFDPTFDDFV